MLLLLFALLQAFVPILTEMNSRIVNGLKGDIRQFSYAAYLNTICSEYTIRQWCCGATIINQKMLLTAAHCLSPCLVKAKVMVGVGSEERNRVNMIEAKDHRIHEEYKKNSNFLHDIGLILLKCPLKFSDKVGRIILMLNPPKETTALVAGWGGTENKKMSAKLIYARQEVFSREFCNKLLKVRNFQRGAICAGTQNATMYPAPGDSGGALVIRNSIQIGIVSYRKPNAEHIAVYTDVSQHYDWIKRTMNDMLFCNENATKQTDCSQMNLKVKKPHKLRSNLTYLKSSGSDAKDPNPKSGVIPTIYTASVTITCEDTTTGGLKIETSYCGASFINEVMLLTAATCLICHSGSNATVVASAVGNSGNKEVKEFEVKEFKIHEQYNSDPIMNNIAVLLLKKPIVFNEHFGKVVLTANPQYDIPAKVVRSPKFDDSTESITLGPLVYSNQQLFSKSYCQSVITPLPPNSLCAEVDEEVNLAPGNALMIRNGIQIGVVSFIVESIVVYTDTSRYFDWINKTAENYIQKVI